jgi:hypothetical protein
VGTGNLHPAQPRPEPALLGGSSNTASEAPDLVFEAYELDIGGET